LFSIIPRDKEFFDLFEKASGVVIAAAEAYAEVARDYTHREQHIARIRQLEHDGDEVTHHTLEKLDKSFITPFDREDIQRLMVEMDDIIDQVDAAAKRLTLYRINEPTSWFVKQAEVLVRACHFIGDAVAQLRNLKRPGALQGYLVEIHRLENIGDDNNHAAVAELYDRTPDPILVMKWKEIYDLTERAIDRCEDIANTIEGIVLKNT
jgi:hypothetical protein